MSPPLNTYGRKVLFQTNAFEIVSIQWTDKSITPLHDHGWTQCLVLVEEGTFENIIDLGVKKEIQIVEAGQEFSTPIGSKHETRCKTSTGKTLHVYLPKIQAGEGSLRFSTPNAEEIKHELSLSEPTSIGNLGKIISYLREKSISTHSPYFMNQLFSGVLPQMLMAEEFIAQTKTTLATYESGSVLSAVENKVVESLCELIGWKKNSNSGIAVPGGSAANFMAVHCARERLIPMAKKEGMDGRQLKVFVSEEAHYSFKKACIVLGVGLDNLVTVPVDGKSRMRVDDLEDLFARHSSEKNIPLMVVATAGTTVFGAFDDIRALSQVCKRHNVWLHVDGAWGGPVLFSKKLRSLVDGIELADSVTFDAHKLLGANLTTSFFMTRHTEILQQANDVTDGDYIFHSEEILDRGRLSWQCGRKGDAMSFWTIWKSLGTRGLGEFVDRLVGVRDEILPWIALQSRLELIATPDYLNICVRVLTPDGSKNFQWSKTVRERLKENNLTLVNYASNGDGTFLRLILAHPFLTFHHVRQILEWALEQK
jgi:glutamate/tyrosine decarboxylase-like PLP-dependent enzyme/quercetin dioxygenase-like cupin family protein